VKQQEFSIRLHNSQRGRLKVYLEPWGELHLVEPHKVLRIDVSGPVGEPQHLLEIEPNEDSVTLWGWAGSSITVQSA
jgi:hypothetical protein